jgi:hypothetical protein
MGGVESVVVALVALAPLAVLLALVVLTTRRRLPRGFPLSGPMAPRSQPGGPGGRGGRGGRSPSGDREPRRPRSPALAGGAALPEPDDDEYDVVVAPRTYPIPRRAEGGPPTRRAG